MEECLATFICRIDAVCSKTYPRKEYKCRADGQLADEGEKTHMASEIGIGTLWLTP